MLRILSYNIHKGFSWGNFQYVLEGIKESLKEIPLDIIFLQEVWGQHNLSPHHSQFEFLADSLWPNHAYGKNAVLMDGHHGNAILSRYPISRFSNTNISTNRYESRGILHAEVEVPGYEAPVHCLNAHLNLLHRGRVKQVLNLCKIANSVIPDDKPLILAGDFNDWPKRLSRIMKDTIQVSEIFATLHGKYARSFPSSFPLLSLDRIYVRGFSPSKAIVLKGSPWNSLSDHAPLYAEIG